MEATKGLIIFIKNPELGKVKTRLAKDIGNKKALAVYERLTTHTREITMGVDVRKYLYYSSKVIKDDQWDQSEYDKLLQVGDNLGQRMLNAFEVSFHITKKNVIIGSDCLDITTKIIEQSFI